MLWPPAFGRAEWEFGVITGFFDGLPVATMGTTLVVLGITSKPGRVRGLTYLIPALIWIVVVGLAILYLLDVAVALKATPTAMKTVAYRSILKTGLFTLTYVGYYAWLTFLVRRRGRVQAR
ncbi:MAG TPA: hypothetical protein VJN95_06265 [Gemmatimonadales bacterium]|nr:hypothetical protein [Gemmatimonadales bacterium]